MVVANDLSSSDKKTILFKAILSPHRHFFHYKERLKQRGLILSLNMRCFSLIEKKGGKELLTMKKKEIIIIKKSEFLHTYIRNEHTHQNEEFRGCQRMQ